MNRVLLFLMELNLFKWKCLRFRISPIIKFMVCVNWQLRLDIDTWINRRFSVKWLIWNESVSVPDETSDGRQSRIYPNAHLSGGFLIVRCCIDHWMHEHIKFVYSLKSILNATDESENLFRRGGKSRKSNFACSRIILW